MFKDRAGRCCRHGIPIRLWEFGDLPPHVIERGLQHRALIGQFPARAPGLQRLPAHLYLQGHEQTDASGHAKRRDGVRY